MAFDAGESSTTKRLRLTGRWSTASQSLARVILGRGLPQLRSKSLNQYIEYMGRSFYVVFIRNSGVKFYDIRLRGERIIYERSMQKATAQYSGDQPKAANTIYHDTCYRRVLRWAHSSKDMILQGALPFGICDYFQGLPILKLAYHDGNGNTINTNAICIFEADMNFPSSRHRYGAGIDYGFKKPGTVKGAQLIVRMIATVGNYNSIFDYGFHLYGSLEVSVQASGYLQSPFDYPI
ncbi:amine oxidase catalytic domain-containing protein [Didymella exigua CBS 183.55]|uniref:Amine oxidase n=1 Tax=Didymella exigua CBS 183.55 TaxID=1150837 RepID=A0A6A5RPL1_9PLEO|nr:amine oxidase catalytic domain-containing protein [Didymella exigua CBS 183.55]KAF1929363.1 amine oxidase catalytic domain-containing protein [Didymella exigua CBS 183.55]